MRLTDEVPSWIKRAMRVCVYAVVLYLLFMFGKGAVYMGVVNHVTDCREGASQVDRGQVLARTKTFATCVQEKNNVLQNLMMRSIARAIDAMPNNPSDFVGVWNASQPRCTYRFILKADGGYIGRPGSAGCSISADEFTGYWGVFEDRMVWLSDTGKTWPPDINSMDVVDKDLFLLIEEDGTRTKFARAHDLTDAERAMLLPPVSKVAASGTPAPGAVPPPLAAGEPGAGKVAGLPQWSQSRIETERPRLDAQKFVRTALSKEPDWRAHLPPERLADVMALLAEHRCTKGNFAIFSKPGKTVRAIVGSDCEAHDGEGFSEYPLVLVVSDGAVRRIDLSPHGFMYESGTIEAFTDMDDNGRIEIWLRGTVCECDGEPEEGQKELCNCQGSVVVEDVATPQGPPAAPSAPASTPAANPATRGGAQAASASI